MKALIQRLRSCLHRPVSRRRALEIARHRSIPGRQSYEVYDGVPKNASFYCTTVEPCWCIYAPWGDGHDGIVLRSSRVILVSKRSGRVLYDGSAGDEG